MLGAEGKFRHVSITGAMYHFVPGGGLTISTYKCRDIYHADGRDSVVCNWQEVIYAFKYLRTKIYI